jgi:hypothetical protein
MLYSHSLRIEIKMEDCPMLKRGALPYCIYKYVKQHKGRYPVAQKILSGSWCLKNMCDYKCGTYILGAYLVADSNTTNNIEFGAAFRGNLNKIRKKILEKPLVKLRVGEVVKLGEFIE